MGAVLTPSAADALGFSFTGVDVQDPDGIDTSDPRVASAETFGKPIQDEVLALIASSLAPFSDQQLFSCASGLNVDDPVYISSSLTVALADATTAAKAKVVGWVRNKPSSTTCYIKHFLLENIVSGSLGSTVFLADGPVPKYSTTAGTNKRALGVVISGTADALLLAHPLLSADGWIQTAALADNAATNAKLAQIPTATFKGRTTAGTGNVEDLTVTQATALLNAFTGDSGSGGVKGLVPAPSAGDAAANKYLKASGAWASIAIAIGDVSGLGAGVATFLATPSSSNLASAVTDETGSGALVFATSPALTTPNIGTPSAGTLTNCTGLPVAGGGTGLTTMPGINHFRLTGTSGAPVTTSDVSNITTLYWTPYNGSMVSLFDGTRWKLYQTTEKSIALGTLTSSIGYDVFAYDNSGTVTLELLAWTNATTRATALVLQDGVYVKSGATTRLYIGSFYTTSTTQTQDTARQRLIWNQYNRVDRVLAVTDTTDSWTYTTAAYRQARATTTNQVEVFIGLTEATVDITVHNNASSSTSVTPVYTGIGVNSTTFSSAYNGQCNLVSAGNDRILTSARLTHNPSLGYTYYAWLEISAGAGTTTWYGDAGSGIGSVRCGITGRIEA